MINDTVTITRRQAGLRLQCGQSRCPQKPV